MIGLLRKPLGAGLSSIAAVIDSGASGAVRDGRTTALGIPLVMLARRLIARSVQLMLLGMLSHPVDELTKMTKKSGRRVGSAAREVTR